jgi:hypothetical protein
MSKLRNYKASVEVQSGMKPMNDNNFPLMQAHDIVIDENDTRLDEYVGVVFRVKPHKTDANDTSKIWERVTETKFKISISSAELGFKNPYVDDVIVYSDKGVGEKTVLDAIEFTDGTVRIYSNLAIDCKITLKGDRING